MPSPGLGCIAVYGSLLQAEGLLETLGAAVRLRFKGPARLPGRLFDLGEYPGLLVAPGDHSVWGELFEILDVAVLDTLDDYEGFDPQRSAESPFIRQIIQMIDPPVEAWTYVYNRPIDGCPEIIGLSWPEYKAQRKR